jgi:hypothetical protein
MRNLHLNKIAMLTTFKLVEYQKNMALLRGSTET